MASTEAEETRSVPFAERGCTMFYSPHTGLYESNLQGLLEYCWNEGLALPDYVLAAEALEFKASDLLRGSEFLDDQEALFALQNLLTRWTKHHGCLPLFPDLRLDIRREAIAFAAARAVDEDSAVDALYDYDDLVDDYGDDYDLGQPDGYDYD